MPLGFWNRLCQILQHPLRKETFGGTVCLLCRECHGFYAPRQSFIDKIYKKLYQLKGKL